MAKKIYLEKLKDPRWQKKRLKILERDNWECKECYDTKSTLHVHHREYIEGRNPWNHPLKSLITLCENCHNITTISEKLLRKMIAEGGTYNLNNEDEKKRFLWNYLCNIFLYLHSNKIVDGWGNQCYIILGNIFIFLDIDFSKD